MMYCSHDCLIQIDNLDSTPDVESAVAFYAETGRALCGCCLTIVDVLDDSDFVDCCLPCRTN